MIIIKWCRNYFGKERVSLIPARIVPKIKHTMFSRHEQKQPYSIMMDWFCFYIKDFLFFDNIMYQNIVNITTTKKAEVEIFDLLPSPPIIYKIFFTFSILNLFVCVYKTNILIIVKLHIEITFYCPLYVNVKNLLLLISKYCVRNSGGFQENRTSYF